MYEAVRKFGLAYCDFPTMLSNINIFLRTLSLNVDPRNQARIPRFYTFLDIAFGASYCYVYLVSTTWFIFWRCMETKDILSALIIFSLETSSQIGLYKIIFMFYHRIKLTRLVGLCLDSYLLATTGSRFLTNLNKNLRTVKIRALIFWCVIMGNGFLYILKPIVLPGRHLMEDAFVLLGLEPMFETPNYQIAFVLTAMGDCFTVYFPSNATTFQIIVSGYIESQMLAWSEELSNLWQDTNKYCNENRIKQANDTDKKFKYFSKENSAANDYINQHLKSIIKAHASNLTLFTQMENSFKGVTAIEFSLLMVGLIAELLAGLQNTYMEVPFALMQVGMDCYTGQKIIDANITFERAVYHCNWENFNKDNMKLIVITLLMSQKTMTLTAGGITKLNFVSLLAIIKMIYSTYTTLSAAVN